MNTLQRRQQISKLQLYVFDLRHKIRSSAPLLSPVSPSRLTEELLKIINSGHSKDIIEVALDTDLYIYLQPAATNMMLENKKFAKAYMKSLKELDEAVLKDPNIRLGEKLSYILRDFVGGLTDWNLEAKSSSAADLYKMTWARCRNFVLPMNPQRTELDFAVRKILNSYGIQVKQPKKRTKIILPAE